MKKIVYLCLSLLIMSAHASALIERCASCHGLDGMSTRANIPHLASQHPNYLLRQLQAFKTGVRRKHPPVSSLTDEQLTELATYYAAQLRTLNTPTTSRSKRGEILYRQGDSARHIIACITCHGPDGMGSPYAQFPLLAGQKPRYTIRQLKAFRYKTRQTDLQGIMQSISSTMNNDDIQAVADYIAGLPVKIKEKQ